MRAYTKNPLTYIAVGNTVFRLALFLVAFGGPLFGTTSIYAHGAVVIFDGPVGSYLARIDTTVVNPKVDSFYHMDLLLTDPITGSSLEAENVKVTVFPTKYVQGSTSTGPITFNVLNEGDERLYLDLVLSDPGDWEIRVDIDGPLGVATTTFTLNAVKSGIPFWSIAVGGSGIFLIIALGWTVVTKSE